MTGALNMNVLNAIFNIFQQVHLHICDLVSSNKHLKDVKILGIILIHTCKKFA